MSDGDFSTAWEILVTRYHNPRFICKAYLDRIYSLTPMSDNTSHELWNIITTVKSNLHNLKTQGCPVEHWDLPIAHHITGLLNQDTLMKWEIQVASRTDFPSLQELLTYLTQMAKILEVKEMIEGGEMKEIHEIINFSDSRESTSNPKSLSEFNENSKTDSIESVSVSSLSVKNVTTAEMICDYCTAKHHLSKCKNFALLPVIKRKSFVERNQLCVNCLGSHQFDFCRNPNVCHECGSRHHTFIHE